ncbi:hypothetical protein LFAB_14815 [Lactiplantibacillus fabifermentans T30PCM01]|uniref:Uncharacterized protein n=1 Tax=Lactiplantibacillus fabifermentans T30PCM01 TaxID=1400520 RepID=W6T4V9_9LACO|nr:hypothetical protein LFAB_14815 [Lactiplantibacillus fabifermentans T30PCM01]
MNKISASSKAAVSLSSLATAFKIENAFYFKLY